MAARAVLVVGWGMHPRHRLDLRASEAARALTALATAWRRGPLENALLRTVGAETDGLAALSVRAGWDLLLTACAWPARSEVLVSTLTHPAMADLVAEAGLVPVPVEVDLDTLLPTPSTLATATTSRTRAVLVAQLFGGRADLSALAALCHERGLLLVEDAAQAWTGPATLRSAADVTLVSFGLLKTATAAGGALVRVSDPALRGRLRQCHARWPVQPRRAYASRLVQALVLLALSVPSIHGLVLRGLRLGGADLERVVDRMTRSVSASTRHGRRWQPSAPLLATMARRLRSDDPSVARLRARTQAGECLRASLPARLPQPGDRADRTHWLFPVRAEDPGGLVMRLRQVGVDASAATSNLVALTTDGPAADLMRHVVYVPAYPELPVPTRTAVCGVLAEQAG